MTKAPFTLKAALAATATAAEAEAAAWRVALQGEYDELHAWIDTHAPDDLRRACSVTLGRVAIHAAYRSGCVAHTFQIDGRRASRARAAELAGVFERHQPRSRTGIGRRLRAPPAATIGKIIGAPAK